MDVGCGFGGGKGEFRLGKVGFDLLVKFIR